MTDDRCKELMQQMGMPDSLSLYQALHQVANETAQKYAPELEAASREAISLAESLHKQYYAEDSPLFELCDSVPGIISQIDNMVCGLTKAPKIPSRLQDVDPMVRTLMAEPACNSFS